MATTAGEVLLAYLGQQLAELRQHAPGVRAEQPEAVHQMRVAARRLRSLLASGRPLLDDSEVQPLRAELRWLSGTLGAARDPGVVHERLSALLADEPEDLRFGPAALRIDEELDALTAAGFAAALEAVAGERYARLLADLDRFVASAALSPKAAADPGKRFAKLANRDRRRLRRTVQDLPVRDLAVEDPSVKDVRVGTGGDDDGGAPDGPPGPGAARDAALHEVRKAAKRLRYSAELAASVPKGSTGDGDAGRTSARKRHRRAKRLAKAARKIQQVLGVHQDSVVARARLAGLGARALRSGENGFTYGRLHAREEQLAAVAERAFLKRWKKFPDR